jgi:hypothetical protein
MKKIIFAILCVFLLAACAATQEPAPATPVAPATPTPITPATVPGVGWRTLEEELRSTEERNNGVFAPTWVAFEQDLCRAIDYDFTEESRVRPAGKVSFNGEYECTAYRVEHDSEVVAVILNGQFVAFRRQFNLIFEVGGMEGRLLWSPTIGTDFDKGKELVKYDGFTVYEAVSLTEESTQELYIVDVTELLKTSMPDQFGGCGVVREFYWLAKPDGLVSGSKC